MDTFQTFEEASDDAVVAHYTVEEPFTASEYDPWNIAVYDHGRGDGWKGGYIKGIEIQKGISASMLSRMLEICVGSDKATTVGCLQQLVATIQEPFSGLEELELPREQSSW